MPSLGADTAHDLMSSIQLWWLSVHSCMITSSRWNMVFNKSLKMIT